MSASGYVHIEVEQITGETDKAFFVRYEGQDICLPKSQIIDVEDLAVGDINVTVSITSWLAEQKGIET